MAKRYEMLWDCEYCGAKNPCSAKAKIRVMTGGLVCDQLKIAP